MQKGGARQKSLKTTDLERFDSFPKHVKIKHATVVQKVKDQQNVSSTSDALLNHSQKGSVWPFW